MGIKPQRTEMGPQEFKPLADLADQDFYCFLHFAAYGPGGGPLLRIGGVPAEAYLRSPRGKELLETHARVFPGSRPTWWWRRLGPPAARKLWNQYASTVAQDEATALRSLGLLTPDEERRLAAGERRVEPFHTWDYARAIRAASNNGQNKAGEPPAEGA